MADFNEMYLRLFSNIFKNIENLAISLEDMQIAMILAGDNPPKAESLTARQTAEGSEGERQDTEI